MSKRCFIFGAGDETDIPIRPTGADIVIAADGGLSFANIAGISPNVFIGDLDSLEKAPETNEKIILPTEKDDTDTMYAVKFALSRGADELYLYGCAGKRLDHTLANISAAAHIANSGKKVFLFGKDHTLTVIKNTTARFGADFYGVISVFPWGKEAEGVTQKGFKYQTEDITYLPNIPLGVSNEFIGKESFVTVKDGTLLIIWNESREKLPDIE